MSRCSDTQFSFAPLALPIHFTPTSQAKPFMLCAGCLYSAGLGYDRIAKRLKITKQQVYGFIRLRTKIFGDVKGRRLVPQRHEIVGRKKKRLSEQEKALRRALKLQKTLEKRKLRKVKSYLRHKITRWIFDNEHARSASELAGCSKEHFMAHIAARFKRGMSWDNYGKVWEFDHIVPCAAFNLYDAADRKRCFHFSNYQPKRVSDNRHKSARIIACQPELPINFVPLKSRCTSYNRSSSVTKQAPKTSNATSKAFVPLENAGVLQTQQRTGLTSRDRPAPVQRESGPITIAL